MILKLILKVVLTHHFIMGSVIQILNNLDLTYLHNMHQEMQTAILTRRLQMVLLERLHTHGIKMRILCIISPGQKVLDLVF